MTVSVNFPYRAPQSYLDSLQLVELNSAFQDQDLSGVRRISDLLDRCVYLGKSTQVIGKYGVISLHDYLFQARAKDSEGANIPPRNYRIRIEHCPFGPDPYSKLWIDPVAIRLSAKATSFSITVLDIPD